MAAKHFKCPKCNCDPETLFPGKVNGNELEASADGKNLLVDVTCEKCGSVLRFAFKLENRMVLASRK
jgi:RNase P subunit RPR2